MCLPICLRHRCVTMPGMSGWGRMVVCIVATTLVLLTGCSERVQPPEDVVGQSATTSAPAPDALEAERERLAELPEIAVPGLDPVEISVESLHGTPPDLEPLLARSRLIEVSVSASADFEEAEIRWPLPEDWEDDWEPVVVWEDGEGGWRWLPTERLEVDGREYAVARTDHFSGGFLASFDPMAFARGLSRDLENMFAGRAGAEAPQCEGTLPTDAYTLRSDSLDGFSGPDDAVLWCAGWQDGRPVLKVTNNRRMLAQVTVPTGVRVIGTNRGISLQDGIAQLGANIEHFAAGLPSDRSTILIDSGGTIVIEVSETVETHVEVTASPVGYGLSVMLFGIDMYLGLANKAGLDTAVSNSNFFWMLGDGLADNTDWALAALSCLDDFTKTYTADLTGAVSMQEEIARGISFMISCGFEVGAVSVLDSGPLAWFVSSVVATLAALLSIAVTALELLVAAIAELRDWVMYAFGSVDDPVFDLVAAPVHRPSVELIEGGRGMAIDGEWAPENAEPWLLDRLGPPDRIVHYENCMNEGLRAKQLTWGDLSLHIMVDAIPDEVYMYGFAWPPGTVSGFQYDLDQDGDGDSSHDITISGTLTLPVDRETAETHLQRTLGNSYGEVDTYGNGWIQGFAGDVTNLSFSVTDNMVRSASAGMGCADE